jgi:hypothetical protein
LDRNTKEFKLYTPCGKTFAIIAGVLFSSLRPTKDEIAYAIELLDFWLSRNKAIIDQYIDAFTTLQLYADLPDEQNDMKVSNVGGWNDPLKLRVRVLHNDIKYFLNKNGELTAISWENPIATTIPLKLPAAKIGTALEFLEEHFTQRECKKIVDNILSEMNTCKDL